MEPPTLSYVARRKEKFALLLTPPQPLSGFLKGKILRARGALGPELSRIFIP